MKLSEADHILRPYGLALGILEEGAGCWRYRLQRLSFHDATVDTSGAPDFHSAADAVQWVRQRAGGDSEAA